jgi:hypothetical protein
VTLSRTRIVIAAMAVAIAVLAGAVVYFARDELRLVSEAQEEQIATPSAVGEEEGFAVVSVSPESQKASGLQTIPLQGARAQAAIEVYGVVVDPRPLIEQRARLLALAAEREAVRVAAASTQAEHQRLKRLYDDERNVAERVVMAAEAQWKSEQARLAAVEQQATAVKEALRAGWGPALAAWAAQPQSHVLDALVQQQQVLVQLVIPYDLQASAGRDEIQIAPVGAPLDKGVGLRGARFVSASPRTDGSLPGATYFFLADARDLRVGTRVAGQLRLPGKAREGVLVPEAAVVWHGGKAWAYVKDSDARFVRREVSTAQELPGGWFNASRPDGAGFEDGEQVVVSGAQLLLSEEFKFQIRNENED